MTREDSLVRSAVFEHFFEDTEEMTFADGLNFTVAFRDYGNETESILDPAYGHLILEIWKWGSKPDSSVFDYLDRLTTHVCSLEEPGLTEDRSNATFYEIGKH